MKEFYNGKKVLITGHTGFKGSWLCEMLLYLGANVTGYALKPEEESAFVWNHLENRMQSYIGDVRDFEKLQKVFEDVQPEIVIHMAAQPLVRESYKNPRETYEINVMGTVNVCECVRTSGSVKSFLNVTTDKVYHNNEWIWGYRETDPLDGYDPYSNSKSCSELVTHSYIHSFLEDLQIAVSTARAGNVIGGGDFSKDRIIPDCVRAAKMGQDIIIRNPYSTRPYQHVLEPLSVYLTIAKEQYQDLSKAGFYNVGPDDCDCVTTGELATLFCEKWGQGLQWINQSDRGPHEAQFLKLDCTKLKTTFGWTPRWHIETAVEKVVEWTTAVQRGKDSTEITQKQIDEFFYDR